MGLAKKYCIVHQRGKRDAKVFIIGTEGTQQESLQSKNYSLGMVKLKVDLLNTNMILLRYLWLAKLPEQTIGQDLHNRKFLKKEG